MESITMRDRSRAVQGNDRIASGGRRLPLVELIPSNNGRRYVDDGSFVSSLIGLKICLYEIQFHMLQPRVVKGRAILDNNRRELR
jgi:hypothetical protein